MLKKRFQPARQFVSLPLLIAAICLTAASVYAQSATFSRTDYAIAGNNNTLGDFNGDGVLDIASTALDGVAVMTGNANGTFNPKKAYPAGGFAQDLTTGDFNGDGKLDLVVTINDPDIGLAVLTGNGDGTFGPPANFPNTSHLDSPAVVATDVDNDGRLDVVVAHQIGCYTSPCVVGRTISVWLGFGDGTFQLPWDMEVGTGMSRIVVSDFNNDGLKDLAIAGDRSQVFVLFGVGNGTFFQQPTIQLTADTLGVDATDIDLADFNSDGSSDLVVAIALNGSRTAILLGNTDGTFRRPSIITEPGSRVPQYQVVGDFNRDGFQDIALALGFGTNGLLEILNGNGDGSFSAPVLYQQPPAKSSVSGGVLFTGDFNRDGKPDIGLPITGASTGLAVLLNSTGGVAVPPVAAIGSVTASPSSVVGGNTSQITVTLANGATAPSGGYSFKVASSSATVSVPSTVSIARGGSSVSFNATTRSVTREQSVTISVSNNQLGSRQVVLTVTPPQAPPPPTITLSAVSVNPASVTGGNSAQGSVTLSGPASAATVINLASSNAAASLPASVTIAAGASSASFNINTATVAATTSVTISATLNATTRTTTLTLNPQAAPPPPPTADTLRISRAEYDAGKQKLRVDATSTSSNATLEVFNTATGQSLGTLSNNGGGHYSGQLNSSVYPRNITIRSSLGGTVTGAVDNK
jgi:hypothetical protein